MDDQARSVLAPLHTKLMLETRATLAENTREQVCRRALLQLRAQQARRGVVRREPNPVVPRLSGEVRRHFVECVRQRRRNEHHQLLRQTGR